MATKGNKTVISNNNQLTFYWEKTATTIGANITSTIKYQLVFTSAVWFTEAASPAPKYTIVIDGNTITGTASIGTMGAGQAKVLAEGLITLNHGNKGNEKTFSFSFEQNLQSLGVLKGSGTGVLDAVSAPGYIISGPNFRDTETPIITYYCGRGVEALDICIADVSGITIHVPYRAVPIVEGEENRYTFSFSAEERAKLIELAGGSTFVFKYYLRSKINGTTYLKSWQASMFATSSTLTLTPEVTEGNSAVLALTGNANMLILGYSTANYSINASTTSGATITSQYVINGNTKKTEATGSFPNVPNNVFSFSAADSKGNSKLITIELDTVPYIPITCNQTVKLNMDGTATINITGNYFNGSFGAQNNSIMVETRSRKDSGEWTAWGDISVLMESASGGTYNLHGTISGFDPSGSYEFEARATDKLMTAYSASSSISLMPVFDWGRNDFNFNVPISIEGNALNDYVVESGTEAMGTNGTWYWAKYKSGKAVCYGCRNYGNMGVNTTWGGLYRSEAFVQDLPIGLFKDIPEVIDVTFRNSNYGGWIAKHESSAPTSSSSGSFIVVRPAGATLSQVYISFNIIGRWR